MSRPLLANRLQAVAGSDTHSFVELVRLSGLKPSRDFKYADLSRADLRGQDMRAFDLSRASLKGALIIGARFNETVRRAQLEEAIAGVPAVVIPIGERLLAVRATLGRHLGENVFVPDAVLEALRPLADAPQRRVETDGVYLGDSSDLVRRRLSHHFKRLSNTLRASGVCFVLVEPDTDFDFDILNVVLRYLRRDGIRVFVFVFPQLMEREPVGAQLLAARLRNLDADIWLSMSKAQAGRRTNLHGKPTELLSQLERSRERVLGFIWVAANARPQIISSRERVKRDFGETMPVLIDGARRGRESLAAAISRDVTNGYPGELYLAERHHAFIREDLYSADNASIIAGQLGGQRAICEFSTYARRADFEAEYFVASGPASSGIWDALKLR